MDDKAIRKKELVTWIEELGQRIINKAQSLDMTEAEYTALRWVFDNMEHVEAGENENLTELTATIIYMAMGIIHNHKEALNKLYDESFRLSFVQELTKEDLRRFNLNAELLEEIDPFISYAGCLDVFGLDGAIALVEAKTSNKKTYRTKAKAEAVGAITQIPVRFPIITQRHYLEALNVKTRSDSTAYLGVIKDELRDSLTVDKEGRLYNKGRRNQGEKIESIIDNTVIYNTSSLDLLTPLKYYYGLFLEEFKRRGGQSQPGTSKEIGSIKVSASVITGIPNPTERDILKTVETLKAYSNMTGVVCDTYGRYSLYQVLVFEYYDAETNTFSIKSPYTDYIINQVYNESYKYVGRDSDILRIKKNGDPVMSASHSYIIDASIFHERNRSAIETVILLVTLIERSGAGTPNKKLSAIIEENPLLKARWDNDRQHRTRNLQRHFETVWRLLKEHTHLTEKYNNLRISTDRMSEGVLLEELDPKDKRFIPTAKMVKTMCFYFQHDGTNKAFREKESLS